MLELYNDKLIDLYAPHGKEVREINYMVLINSVCIQIHRPTIYDLLLNFIDYKKICQGHIALFKVIHAYH